jgi:hypothetical protein
MPVRSLIAFGFLGYACVAAEPLQSHSAVRGKANIGMDIDAGYTRAAETGNKVAAIHISLISHFANPMRGSWTGGNTA